MTKANEDILYQKELESALDFLKRSIDVHHGCGSSHSYSYWLNQGSGWHTAYPETTGYLIPTLINASFLLNDEDLLGYAENCSDWLVKIQSGEGWYYSGVEKSNGPSIFNTAMILFGLSAAIRQFPKEEYISALKRSVSWMLNVQEKDGRFLKFAFHSGFHPSYYSRVLWALAEANEVLLDVKVDDACERLRESLKPFFHSNGIDKAGFTPSDSAYLHTMVYAYRGAKEYNIKRSQDQDAFDISGFNKMVNAYISRGEWPGSIDQDGAWNNNFRCLTGEAQMATLLLMDENPLLHEAGKKTLKALLDLQKRSGPARGGLPGSKPFWGPYMPLRYPNWAAKFLADAILMANGMKVRG